MFKIGLIPFCVYHRAHYSTSFVRLVIMFFPWPNIFLLLFFLFSLFLWLKTDDDVKTVYHSSLSGLVWPLVHTGLSEHQLQVGTSEGASGKNMPHSRPIIFLSPRYLYHKKCKTIFQHDKKKEQATSNVREDKKWAAFTMHTHARPKEVGSLSLIVSFTLCLLFASLCRIFWSILRTGDPNKKLLFPKKISSFLSDSKKLKKPKKIYIVLCPTNFKFLKTTLKKLFSREYK